MQSLVDKMKIEHEYPIGSRVRVTEQGVYVVTGIVVAHDIIGERICIRDDMQLRWWEWLGRPGVWAHRID